MEWNDVEQNLPDSGNYVLVVCKIDFGGGRSAPHITEAMFCRKSRWKVPALEKLQIIVHYWAEYPEIPEWP